MDIARSLPTAAFTGVGHSALDQSRQGISEVRNSWRLILQATVAASLAYGIAESIGHEVPFFAPIAAIATVAVSLAHRRRPATARGKRSIRSLTLAIGAR